MHVVVAREDAEGPGIAAEDVAGGRFGVSPVVVLAGEFVAGDAAGYS